jgi:hypothetical protein
MKLHGHRHEGHQDVDCGKDTGGFVADATFYKWKAKYGGLEVAEARRLKSWKDENRRLKNRRMPRYRFFPRAGYAGRIPAGRTPRADAPVVAQSFSRSRQTRLAHPGRPAGV